MKRRASDDGELGRTLRQDLEERADRVIKTLNRNRNTEVRFIDSETERDIRILADFFTKDTDLIKAITTEIVMKSIHWFGLE
jgi:hypothetical protein